jgi:UDP-glucuronate decarboxylase
MNDGRVVSNFVLQALQNEPITVSGNEIETKQYLSFSLVQIYGSGKQTRSFQYVSDLVDGLIALMNSNYSMPMNLGNPDEYTIEQFAIKIKNLVGECDEQSLMNNRTDGYSSRVTSTVGLQRSRCR